MKPLLVAFLCFVAIAVAQDRQLGTRCDPCDRIDLIFSIENSNQVTSANFDLQKLFVQNIATRYQENMRSGARNGSFPRLGVTTWNSPARGNSRNPVPLTSNYTLFLQQLAALSYTATAQSNMTEAMLYPHSLLLSTPEKVARLVIIVSSAFNYSNSFTPLGGEQKAARLLLQQGTFPLFITVGSTPSHQSWAQLTVLSGYFGYSFVNWAAGDYGGLAVDAGFLGRVFDFACKFRPLPRLIRPACPMEDGSFSNKLKAYPPAGYAVGTFLPNGYTTWGRVDIPNLPNFPPLTFTLRFWVYLRSNPPASTKANWTFFSQAPADGLHEAASSIYLGLVDGRIRFVLGNGGNSSLPFSSNSTPYLVLQTTETLKPRNWYLISVNVEALNRSASFWPDETDFKYASINVNGATWARTIFTNPTISLNTPLQMGRARLMDNISRCDCVFDELTIYNTCLNMATQGAIANRVQNGREPNTLGYWNFEDATGWNYPDLSVNNLIALRKSATPWLVQVAELDPNYCSPNAVHNIREYETLCKDPVQ